MKNSLQNVDFDSIVNEARMERSIAIASAISDVVAMISRGFDRVFSSTAHAVLGGEPESKVAHR